MWVLIACLLSLGNCARESELLFTLKDTNLDKLFSKYSRLVVAFLSGTCQYSSSLSEELTKKVIDFSTYSSNIHVCKVDCLLHAQLCDKYSIDRYPTIKLFVNQRQFNYTGALKVDALARWVAMKCEEPVMVHKTLDHFSTYQYQKESYAVLFSTKESPEYKEFEAMAIESGDDIYGLAAQPEFAEKCNVTQPSMILYKYQERLQFLYTGPWRATRMKEFVQKHKKAWLAKVDDNVMEYVFTLKEPRLVLLYYGSMNPSNSGLMDSISAEVRHDIRVAYHDLQYGTEEDKFLNFLGVPISFLPGAIILSWSEGALQKYKLDSPLSRENLLAFVEKWKTGKARTFIKSEKLPEERPDDVVKVLVGNNFKETVYGGSAHVLVLIYAPWSPKSKTVLPIYEFVGQHFKPKGREPLKVLVAKIDGTANDLSDATPLTFPVLKLYRKNKFPITYEGTTMTSTDIISFVEDNLY